MSEVIHMNVNAPSAVPMEPSAPVQIRASIPSGGTYVTYEELQAILASYATKEELNNDTVMRWGSEETLDA